MNALGLRTTPLLPTDAVQYLSVHLGWGLVLACLLVYAISKFGLVSRSGVAVGIVLALAWCLAPGSASLSYWLGLAFQAPSLVTVLLCIWYLQHAWRGQPASKEIAPGLLPIGIVGALLGCLLLADMLAWLPWQIYALGFSPATTAAVFFVALLPWMLHGRAAMADTRTWIAPLAIGIFVALRWPSGNVWDAALDPWLWVGLNGVVLRSLWRRHFVR